MNFDEIQKLVQSISDSPLSEFEYEADGVRLHIKKEKAVAVVAEQAAPVLMATAPSRSGAGWSCCRPRPRSPAPIPRWPRRRGR